LHDAGIRARGAPLPKWRPELPECDLRRIYLHWTGGDYGTAFAAYHFCVALGSEGVPIVCATHELRANARDLRLAPAGDYAAHTQGRNSFACGLAVAGMRNATPADFGAFPLRDDLVAALCAVAARIAERYAIPLDAAHVMTHAEAALEDGYFGAAPEQRWDIARFSPEPRPLEPADAARAGESLRERIRAS
jgi:hypothetical protein